MTSDSAVKAPRTVEEITADLEEARAHLQKVIGERDQEMVASKEQYMTERDPGGWEGYAEEVYEAFFEGYPDVASMLDYLKNKVVTDGWVISPLGRRRTLYRVLTGNPKFVADAQRRGVNSPVQGVSSEGGITVGYLLLVAFDEFLRTWNLPDKMFTCYCRAVHDANYFEEAVEMLIPAVHIHQHVATVGLAEHLKKVYNKTFPLMMEVDIEIGPSDARGQSWDWQLTKLPKIIDAAIDGRVADGYIKKENRDRTLQRAMQPWISKDMRQWLQSNYPLMQVPDLEEQICQALTENGYEPER